MVKLGLNQKRAYQFSQIVFFILILTFIFVLKPNQLLCQKSEDLISFEKFISRFDLEKQNLAKQIWSEILIKNQGILSELVTPAIESISDSALFAEISSENKLEYLEQLKIKRLQLKKLNEKLAQLKFAAINWDKFVDAIENIPELGSMFIETFTPHQQYKKMVSQKEIHLSNLQKEITDIRVNASLSEISLSFTLQDWITIILYLILNTGI